VLPGPDASVLGDVAATTWTVGGASDRMGLRLEGPPLAAAGSVGERRPHGVVPGTIQLPPDGLPIILLADAQPTGGYPVPAIAISADLPVLGQLRPGAILRLRVVDMSTASAARAERAARLERGRERLAQVSGWDDMWRWADG
jgi:allophanate hydrolase subunit 2